MNHYNLNQIINGRAIHRNEIEKSHLQKNLSINFQTFTRTSYYPSLSSIIPIVRRSNKSRSISEIPANVRKRWAIWKKKKAGEKKKTVKKKGKNAGTHARHARDDVHAAVAWMEPRYAHSYFAVSWRPPIADELQCVSLRDACVYTPPFSPRLCRFSSLLHTLLRFFLPLSLDLPAATVHERGCLPVRDTRSRFTFDERQAVS